MVPTLCVVTQSGTLQRPEPQSGSGCIPTQSVGTMKCLRNTVTPRSHAPRGNAFKARCATNHGQRLRIRDAARPTLYSHVARGNEVYLSICV